MNIYIIAFIFIVLAVCYFKSDKRTGSSPNSSESEKMQEEFSQLRLKYEQLQSEHNFILIDNNSLKNKLNSEKQNLDDADAEIDRLESELEKTNIDKIAAISSLQMDNASLQETISVLNKKLENANTELKKLRIENDYLKNELSLLRQNIENSRQESISYFNELESLKKTNHDLTLTCQQQALTIHDLQNDNNSCLETNHNAFNDLKVKYEQLQNMYMTQHDLLLATRKNLNVKEHLLSMHQSRDAEYYASKRELYDKDKQLSISQQKIEELTNTIADMQSYISHQNEDVKQLLSGKDNAFSYMTILYSDYLLIEYEKSAQFLETKKHPALTEAKRIRDLKEQTEAYLHELTRLRYTLSDLFNIYPELESVSDFSNNDNDATIETFDNTTTISVSEDWESLSDAQKSQIILEKYIKRSKSKWEIGRDYELYVGYQYNKLGYKVDYCGSYMKLSDLGRDLIVCKNNTIEIIQCKYWSHEKTIHEKHIAQLYGTVISYIIENQIIPDLVHGVFITNITLSPMAKKFASYLEIEYKENYPMGDFPRIKCNINKDSNGKTTKIYHLPTDQQYDNVKIEHEGECFVFTAEEAEKLGFRRAFRWNG